MTINQTSANEERRLGALRQYGVLDTEPEQALDDLTALAATICETPIALITLVDDRRQWFKSKIGLELAETARDDSFCVHALEQPGLLVVPDATRDERFARSPLVTGEPGIRFYAGMPLITPEGEALGTLCVIDRVPRKLTPMQEQTLRVLGGQVMAQLELHRRTRELQTSERKLRAIIDTEPECVKLLGVDATLYEINPAGLRLIEADSLTAVRGHSLLSLVVPDDRPAVSAMLVAAAAGARRKLQFRIIGYRGTRRWLEMTGVPFHDEVTGQDAVLSISHDITERQEAEEKIHRLNRLYAVASGINEAIVRVRTTQELYEQACRIAVERGGLVMAWVGLEEGERRELRPVARWGRDEGYLDAIQISTMLENPTGMGPAGQAFRLGALAHCPDIAADAGTFATKAEARQRGYQSCAAFPVKIEGRPAGVLVVYGDQPGYFDDEVLQLLNALAENISFAVEARGREKQREEAEEALRASEGRYRALFEYAPDGILIADSESRYLDANAAICRMLGYNHRELTSLGAADIVAPAEIVHIAGALEAVKSKTEYHREWQLRRKDGSVFAAEVIATLMPDGNLLAMIRDVTERKRQEARFRRLVDSTAQGVIFWKTNGEITGANDAFLGFLGYSREDLEAGRLNWLALTPPEFADLDRRCLAEVAARGSCTPYEKEYIRRDGSRAPMLIGAASFEDQPEEGVCFAMDLTERKKLEQQFLRAQRMEGIGTLAAGIAHDLNNSLGPIIMSLDLLKMRFLDADSQDLLDIISTSAQRGADMVRQVLSFGRGVEGRRMEVQIEPLVEEIQKIANDTFLKSIQVQTRVPHDLRAVMGDPTQLHQVLLNLCVNARDAMPDGGRLIITAENITFDAHDAGMNLEAKAGSYVLLRVEDNGVGISPEVVGKVFDPFFTTKEIGKGTGLGLSTTLAIVKSHGGFVRVASEQGVGTKFEVYLPAREEASPEAIAALNAEMPRGHGECILVVDDELSVREITRATLETFGYRVLLAADGTEAITVFATRGEEIAVMLTDMMMPVMDGPTAIHVLRRMKPDLPIIAASGLATPGQMALMTRLGVKYFLPKPYTAAALLKSLQEILAPR